MIGRRAKRSKAIRDVEQERERHVALGYTASHDDQHAIQDLIRYSRQYSTAAMIHESPDPLSSRRRDDLVKAAAVLVAAIESFDRRRS